MGPPEPAGSPVLPVVCGVAGAVHCKCVLSSRDRAGHGGRAEGRFMGRTVDQLTPQERRAYQQDLWRALQEQEQQNLRRQRRAAAVAAQAARWLRREYGARQVFLFGSLARGTFGPGSDIDLAVEGISDGDLLRAQGRLLGEFPEFPIDLVDLASTSPSLREAVEREGKPL